MTRAPSFAGVILAAGESSRMGADKALLPWPPAVEGRPRTTDTFLSATIRSLSLSTDFIVVVAGKNQAAIAPVAYSDGASIIVNPDPDRGQFSSLQIGLHEVLNRGRDAAIITLVDRPPANPATIQILREAFAASGNDTWAVVPEFSGQHGHPYIAGRELIEAFLQAAPTATARDVEHAHQQHIVYIPVDDPLVALNINTPDDYAKLAALSS
ncbi:MAG: nucleotidyltransferase family protein [Candidatus Sulfotelmatobacter sp.]